MPISVRIDWKVTEKFYINSTHRDIMNDDDIIRKANFSNVIRDLHCILILSNWPVLYFRTMPSIGNVRL